jgi:hypothetical protein
MRKQTQLASNSIRRREPWTTQAVSTWRLMPTSRRRQPAPTSRLPRHCVAIAGRRWARPSFAPSAVNQSRRPCRPIAPNAMPRHTAASSAAIAGTSWWAEESSRAAGARSARAMISDQSHTLERFSMTSDTAGQAAGRAHFRPWKLLQQSPGQPRLAVLLRLPRSCGVTLNARMKRYEREDNSTATAQSRRQHGSEVDGLPAGPH